MNIEAPTRYSEQENKIQQLENTLRESGFQLLENYTAKFYVEEENAEKIDHMVLSATTDNLSVPLGVFLLKRKKGKTNLYEYLNEYPKRDHALEESASEANLKPASSSSLEDIEQAIGIRHLPEANFTAVFAKWFDARMHTFVLDEKGDIVTIYNVNPDKIKTSGEYFDAMKKQVLFQQNEEEYSDNRHP